MEAQTVNTAEVMFTLADACASLEGQMHTLHLNVTGHEFDTLHKKVFQDYYGQLAEDYDSAAEWGRCAGAFAPNKNEAAQRVKFLSLGPQGVERNEAVALAGQCLDAVVDNMTTVFNALNEQKDSLSIGICNWLQSRLEYWVKEQMFFNRAREGVNEYI
jgi:DNA-binding ferritin-like protein